MQDISSSLAEKDFFYVGDTIYTSRLALPSLTETFKYLSIFDEQEIMTMKPSGRIYRKNGIYKAKNAKRIWMADYSIGLDFGTLANEAEGIDRIAVLRADVDNLGKAFTGGFSGQFLNISRTSAFSRMLSLFFKKHVNHILTNPKTHLKTKNERRNAIVVYSGGDDMFIAGGWDDCITLAVDIHDELEKFTGGALSISAGAGIYNRSFPIAYMADDTGKLEDYAKMIDSGKNAVALFDAENVYKWADFKQNVIETKLKKIQEFFAGQDERGMAFIYNMLDLLRAEGQIQLARILYLLVKLEIPAEYSSQIHEWILDGKQKKQLVTALEIYIYLERNG
jgi:CRISPR-associated protein Csm1